MVWIFLSAMRGKFWKMTEMLGRICKVDADRHKKNGVAADRKLFRQIVERQRGLVGFAHAFGILRNDVVL